MSSPTPSIHATSPHTGIGHDDGVVPVFSPHVTGGFLAYQVASVEVGVPKEEYAKELIKPSGLRETLAKTKSALGETQFNVRALESGHTRIKVQFDILIRIQQPMDRPTPATQAPPSLRGMDPHAI
uniref:Uncharacterized protein n=1 Tax=Peronospora matthiolae TaxID=2874970 RepID=A0AAV1UMG7_9STRA